MRTFAHIYINCQILVQPTLTHCYSNF